MKKLIGVGVETQDDDKLNDLITHLEHCLRDFIMYSLALSHS